jgi:hypothetical protein
MILLWDEKNQALFFKQVERLLENDILNISGAFGKYFKVYYTKH